MRKLGSEQKGVLQSLANRGSGEWSPFCGWVWAAPARTNDILRSLVKYGLVEKIEDTEYVYERKGATIRMGRYRITEAGREYAGNPTPARYF